METEQIGLTKTILQIRELTFHPVLMFRKYQKPKSLTHAVPAQLSSPIYVYHLHIVIVTSYNEESYD